MRNRKKIDVFFVRFSVLLKLTKSGFITHKVFLKLPHTDTHIEVLSWNILVKDLAVLRVILNLDGAPITLIVNQSDQSMIDRCVYWNSNSVPTSSC